jgi:hypothetical protein
MTAPVSQGPGRKSREDVPDASLQGRTDVVVGGRYHHRSDLAPARHMTESHIY